MEFMKNKDGELEALCIKCGEWWFPEQFNQTRDSKGNVVPFSWCKACMQEYRNAKYKQQKVTTH